MSSNIETKRKEEIVNACSKLYEEKSFKEITIKDIAEITSFSRPSIYYYFETKEEIFLEILKNEYLLWIDELDSIIKNNNTLSKNDFISMLSKSVENRSRLLKILAMNMYDIEDNTRLELLIEFKKVFKLSIDKNKELLSKYFSNMNEDSKEDFVFSFFEFMYGIYPYTYSTTKQKLAMDEANIKFKHKSIYELTYEFLYKTLKEEN